MGQGSLAMKTKSKTVPVSVPTASENIKKTLTFPKILDNKKRKVVFFNPLIL